MKDSGVKGVMRWSTKAQRKEREVTCYCTSKHITIRGSTDGHGGQIPPVTPAEHTNFRHVDETLFRIPSQCCHLTEGGGRGRGGGVRKKKEGITSRRCHLHQQINKPRKQCNRDGKEVIREWLPPDLQVPHHPSAI